MGNSANTSSSPSENQLITTLTCDEAKQFLLKPESYCTIDLPPYLRFEELLTNVSTVIGSRNLLDFYDRRLHKPQDYADVNYCLFSNKDGRYAWRPLQLIHPAIYVTLVNEITQTLHWDTLCKRFREFASLEHIECLSLPVKSLTDEKDRAEQVIHWWREIEQKSIIWALDYEHLVYADITDCYGSIYTHSIAWAVHGKDTAKQKQNRNDMSFTGNIIDRSIQNMLYGQTNGIPQGSVLMDFIAEMVLGYADTVLAKKITDMGISDYHILRYRDDYRIFVNNPQDGDSILKCLTEVMIDLGLKLNASKTVSSNRVISGSIKKDKTAWMNRKQGDKSLEKHLLIIYTHSIEFPNSGSLIKALGAYHKRILKCKSCLYPMPLISITVDIAYHNPKVYPICTAILSKLLEFIQDNDEKTEVLQKIIHKFHQLPNTGHMEIWLQRISLSFLNRDVFDEPLCKLVKGDDVTIWNDDWITSADLKNALDVKSIYDHEIASSMTPVMSSAEVDLFLSRMEYIE